MSSNGCLCGHPRVRPLTRKEIDQWSRLRGYRIKICGVCGHEVLAPRTAHDVRKVSVFGLGLAHGACTDKVRRYGVIGGSKTIPGQAARRGAS